MRRKFRTERAARGTEYDSEESGYREEGGGTRYQEHGSDGAKGERGFGWGEGGCHRSRCWPVSRFFHSLADGVVSLNSSCSPRQRYCAKKKSLREAIVGVRGDGGRQNKVSVMEGGL